MRHLPLLLLPAILASAAFGQTVAPATPPPPDPRGSFTLTYENDLLSGTDRYYTSGAQFAYRSPSTDLPGPLRWLDGQLDRFVGPGEVRWGFGAGQSIFTPLDTQPRRPDPRDRPYAGYLYGALVVQRDQGNALSTLELQGGVVGPSALGEWAQNGVHEIIGVNSANGWDYQLKDELALNAFFEQTRRSATVSLGGLEADLLPSVSLALGNVSTYAAAGATVRLGQGLSADYGAPRIRPALVGSAFFQPREEFGWYVFAGGQGRAVARDIFLDGSTFRDGPSVDKRPFVGDLSAGLVVHYRGLRLSYSHALRTEEFYGQRGGVQSFGSIGLTARF